MTRTTQTTIVSGITSYAYPYAVYGITSSVPVRVWLDKTELEQGFTITYIGREGQADSATAAQIEVDASLLVGKSTITIKGNTATERLSAPFASGAASPSAGLNLDANQRSANLQEASDAILRSVRFSTPYAPSGIEAVDASILTSGAPLDAATQYFLAARGDAPTRFVLSALEKGTAPPHHELPTRAWQDYETYEAGEVVYYDGRLYRANAEILRNNLPPSANADWLGIDGGWRGIVESGRGYEVGDLILYQSILYIVFDPFIANASDPDLPLDQQLPRFTSRITPYKATVASLNLSEANTGKPVISVGARQNDAYPITITTKYPASSTTITSDTAFIPIDSAEINQNSLLSPFVFESLGTTGGQASIRLAFTKPDGTEETETIHIDLPAAGAIITAFSLRQTQPADTQGTTGDGIAVSHEAFVPIEVKTSAGWARWLDGDGDAVFLSAPEVAERQDAEWNDGQLLPENYEGISFDGEGIRFSLYRRPDGTADILLTFTEESDKNASLEILQGYIDLNVSFYEYNIRYWTLVEIISGSRFNIRLVVQWTAAAVESGNSIAVEGQRPSATLLSNLINQGRVRRATPLSFARYTPPTDGEITLSATETDATTGNSRLTLRAHTGLALAAEGNRIVVAKPSETYQQARNAGRIARIASAEHAEIDLSNASPFFTGVFPILGLSFYGGDVRFVGWGDPDSVEPPDTGSATHEAFVAAAEMGDTTPRIVAYFATPIPDINGSAQTQAKVQTYNAANAVDTNAAFWEALRDAGWDSENLPQFFDIHLAFATNPDATTPVPPTTFESFSTTYRFSLIGAVNPYSGEAVYQHTATLGTATEADLRTHFTAEAAPVWCEIKIYPPQPLQSVLLDRPLPSAAIGDRAYDEHPRFAANARKRSGVSHAETLMNYGDTTDYIGTTITPSLTAANEDIATLKAEVAVLDAQSDKFSNIPASSLPSPSSPVVLMNVHNGKWQDVLPYPATLSSVGGGSIGIAERFSWLFDRIGQSLGSRFCLYNVDQPQDKGCIGGFKITADGQPGTETYTLSNIKSSDLGAVKYDATQGGNVGDTFLNSVGIHGGGTVKLQIGEQPADLKPYPAALARVLTRQHTPQQWRGELRLGQKYTGNDVVLLTDNATRDYDYWRVNSGRLFWTRPRQASDPTGAGDEDFANDYASAVALLTSRSTKMTHAQVVAYSQIHTDEIWQEPVYSESTYSYAFTRVSQHGFPLPT